MNKSDPIGEGRPGFEPAPLRGKRIVVTRARAQSEDITVLLEGLGAIVFHCPTIEVVPPSTWEHLDASIEHINEYDWLVFTSANGARFFFRRLTETRTDGLDALAEHIVCAIGPATARAVEDAGLAANVTASDSIGEGALRAIIDHVGGEENIRGLRFLLPRARVAREALPAALRGLGGHVDAVETYQTVKPDVDRESIIRLFEANSIDAITFTSSSTVSNFAELAGLTDLSGLLGTTLVACIGPVTADTAASFGLKRILQPELYNAAELVRAISKSMSDKL